MGKELITLGYSFIYDEVKELTKQLDEIKELKKRETGSQEDIDGHCIEYFLKDRVVFFAMIHSNRVSYLVRAEKGLFIIEE